MQAVVELLGNPQQVARHYRRFLERMESCDPEFRLRIGQARRGLERVSGER